MQGPSSRQGIVPSNELDGRIKYAYEASHPSRRQVEAGRIRLATSPRAKRAA